MRTVRRLLYRDVVWSVAFVAIAFLSLFFFIDFLDELEALGRNGYTVWHAVISTLLAVPGRLYELFPIAVLIGTIYAMARLAQSSEFTILRTGGLGPVRALRLLLALGVAMSVLTFVTGEYVAPAGEQAAAKFRSQMRGGRKLERQGAWLKEHRSTPDGELSVSIQVGSTDGVGVMRDLRIFEHDAQGRLLTSMLADSAQTRPSDNGSVWMLAGVKRARWPRAAADPVLMDQLPELAWPTTLTPGVVEAAVSPIDSMSTLELWRYSRHLNIQAQTSQRYELQFWKRALYPLACIVMMALALPFAYLHARAGGVSLKVFGGIMLGISFILLNNVVGHLGLLHNWTPWLAAAVPSALYLALSLAAFAWLVRYR